MEYIERVDTFLEVCALNQTFPSRGLHSLCEMMINRPLTHIWKAWCLPAIYFTSRKKKKTFQFFAKFPWIIFRHKLVEKKILQGRERGGKEGGEGRCVLSLSS